MFNLDQKEKFWNLKKNELEKKLQNLRSPLSQSSGTKLKFSKNQASFEELRLIYDLALEEIEDLKNCLSQERLISEKHSKRTEKYKFIIQELEKNNKQLASSLIEKDNKIQMIFQTKQSSESLQIDKLTKEVQEANFKKKKCEAEAKDVKQDCELKIKAQQLKIQESESQILDFQEKIQKLREELELVSKKYNTKNENYEEILIKNRELEDQIELFKQKQSFTNQTQNIHELSKQLKVLEDENINLKEKVEIYEEVQNKKLIESNLLQQLSFIILSKDKSSLNQEAFNLLKKAIGENSSKLIETFQEKVSTYEQENKFLSQRVNQELSSRIENLEKIKVLQESMNKIVNDPSLDIEINRTKAHIITAKSALSNSFHSVKNSFDHKLDFEKHAEIEVFKEENKALKVELKKIRKEHSSCFDLINDLEAKSNNFQVYPTESDIICFLQCEAAALEDMLAETDSPELGSEELY